MLVLLSQRACHEQNDPCQGDWMPGCSNVISKSLAGRYAKGGDCATYTIHHTAYSSTCYRIWHSVFARDGGKGSLGGGGDCYKS